jgi:hypothetical protein
VLFLTHWRRFSVARSGLRTIDGPLDLGLQSWLAFPERLVLEKAGRVVRALGPSAA